MALHQQAELARAKLAGELELAARIQADLFPAVLPQVDGYELAARNRPARQCGGDYYDALRLSRPDAADRLLLCVADVSGKGLPGGARDEQHAGNAAGAHRPHGLARRARRTRERAALRGDAARRSTSRQHSWSSRRDTGALTFVGAGHLDNLVLRASGDVVRSCRRARRSDCSRPALPTARARTSSSAATRSCSSRTVSPRPRTPTTRSSGRSACWRCCARCSGQPARDGHRPHVRGDRCLRRRRAAIRRHHRPRRAAVAVSGRGTSTLDGDWHPHGLRVPVPFDMTMQTKGQAPFTGKRCQSPVGVSH